MRNIKIPLSCVDKRILFSLVLVIFVTAAGMSYLHGQDATEHSQVHLDSDQFKMILNILDSPFTESEERDRAAATLRRAGTNTLPILMAEVNRIGMVGATNIPEATHLKMKLQAAFEVLGSEASPLLPELITEFRAGRSLEVVPYAIAQIGGDQAGRALVEAITNRNPKIQASGVSAIQYFNNNQEVSKVAVQPLVQLLQDRSGPLRMMAANTLGRLRTAPHVVVPALLCTAEKDSDAVVRKIALKAIACFGTNAISAQSKLTALAESDNDKGVRRMARQALELITKEPPIQYR